MYIVIIIIHLLFFDITRDHRISMNNNTSVIGSLPTITCYILSSNAQGTTAGDEPGVKLISDLRKSPPQAGGAAKARRTKRNDALVFFEGSHDTIQRFL